MKSDFLVAVAATAAVAVSGPVEADITVTTELITNGVSQPIYVEVAPGDTERLFIVARTGSIHVVKNGVLLATPFLDITNLVDSTSSSESAMSCMAFHPDYQANGYFYVTYTNLDSDSVLTRFQVTGDPDVADPGSLTVLLTVPQLDAAHNVGWLDFGPDGFLYIGAGDGGFPGSGVSAQDLESLRGKILRIDVNGPAPYGIPLDNPYVGIAGRDEIWASGLRNPWRCNFDSLTGDLWIGDVGRSSWEEIDFQPAGVGGANYGWNCMEGHACHTPADGCTCDDPDLTDPVHVFDHVTGCAVIGGYVYRGTAIAPLQGLYVFTDFCSAMIWVLDPSDFSVTELLPVPFGIWSMGQDHDGELYFVSPSGVRKITIIDCNDNQIPDDEDIANQTSDDCDFNGIPDECDPDCNENTIADACDIAEGTSPDENGNGIPDECDEPADLDGDGTVGVNDFLLLLAAWGSCPVPPEECPADLDGDGTVGVTDFLQLLGAWG